MLDLLLKLTALNYIIVLCVCSVTANSEITVVITLQTWLACKCIAFAIYVEFQVFYFKMIQFIFLASLKHCMKMWRNILSSFVNLHHAYLFIYPISSCLFFLSGLLHLFAFFKQWTWESRFQNDGTAKILRIKSKQILLIMKTLNIAMFMNTTEWSII